MANIEKLREDLRKKERQLEERINKVHSWVGEAIVDELEIDYSLLNTKKDVKEVVSLIKSEMNTNPFSNSDEKEIETSDLNDEENNEY
jgi:gas vesicle protein